MTTTIRGRIASIRRDDFALTPRQYHALLGARLRALTAQAISARGLDTHENVEALRLKAAVRDFATADGVSTQR